MGTKQRARTAAGDTNHRAAFEVHFAEVDCSPLSQSERLIIDIFVDWLRENSHRAAWMASDSFPLSEAPRTGIRIRLILPGGEADGWWEENLQSFMCMDADWNLIKVLPTAWRPLKSWGRA